MSNSRVATPIVIVMVATVLGGAGWWVLTRSGRSGPDMGDTAHLDPYTLGGRVFVSAGCVPCHQPDGRGQPGLYPPLAGSEWVNGNPARLKRIVLHGLDGSVEVKGTRFSNNMQAFERRLSDEQIAGVLTYIRATWGNAAPPVTPAQVKATRAATAGRRAPWTAPELLEVTVDEGAPTTLQTSQR